MQTDDQFHSPPNARGLAPLAVRRRKACALLDCGLSHLDGLIARGELTAFKDGRAVKIPLEALHEYIRRRVAAHAGSKLAVGKALASFDAA